MTHWRERDNDIQVIFLGSLALVIVVILVTSLLYAVAGSGDNELVVADFNTCINCHDGCVSAAKAYAQRELADGVK
jgi:hypothetical protein